MLTASWAVKFTAFGLFLCVHGCQKPGDQPAVQLSASIVQGQAVLHVAGVGSVQLVRDSTVSAASELADVKLVGRVGEAIVLLDTYASQPGPMSMCQAGEERWLRVMSLKTTFEQLRVKFASCRDDIEPDSPGYNLVDGVLELRWLSGPDGQKAAKYRVSPSAEVTRF